jgi:hypothetical protein
MAEVMRGAMLLVCAEAKKGATKEMATARQVREKNFESFRMAPLGAANRLQALFVLDRSEPAAHRHSSQFAVT